MIKKIELALTYDDVLLVPQFSQVLPNQTNVSTRISKDIKLNIPFISAGMDTVTEKDMAVALANLGGLGVIHKSMSIELQAEQVSFVKNSEACEGAAVDSQGRLLCAAAVGVTSDALDRVRALLEAGVDAVVLDTAHGHSTGVISKIKEIRALFPKLTIIAGNVATGTGVLDLAKAGADCVKVGIGPGSICTTRIVSGIGVPQLTAVMNCVEAGKLCGVSIIADGGLKHSGDIVKAMAAGADAVMIGSLFAGSYESPGELIEHNGKKFKLYRGMGSTDAMKAGSGDRYFQNETKKYVPEGVSGAVVCKGSLSDIVFQLIGGLRSGMGYCGAKDLSKLHENAEFVQITTAGLTESHPHDLAELMHEPNY